jgi:hypothetical protein
MLSTKLIENTNKVIFECDLKNALLKIKPKNLIDVKYAVTENPLVNNIIPEPFHYSAIVIYKKQKGDK